MKQEKDTLKNKESQKVSIIDSKSSGIISSNFAIIVGHTETQQGAINYLNETEFVFNSRIALKVQNKLLDVYGLSCKILFRPSGVGYMKQVETIVKSALEANVKYCMELHFNSINGKAFGCEVLVANTSELTDNRLADYITDLLNERLAIRERGNDGVVVVEKDHRGAGMLYALKEAGILSCIVEPCFANIRTKESAAIFEDEDQYVDILVESAVRLMQGKFY